MQFVFAAPPPFPAALFFPPNFPFVSPEQNGNYAAFLLPKRGGNIFEALRFGQWVAGVDWIGLIGVGLAKGEVVLWTGDRELISGSGRIGSLSR